MKKNDNESYSTLPSFHKFKEYVAQKTHSFSFVNEWHVLIMKTINADKKINIRTPL